MKKYNDMEKKLHTGKLISECIKNNELKTGFISRLYGVPLSSLHRFCKHHHLLTSSLWKLCHALQYNFFADIAEMLPKTYKKSVQTPDALRIKELEEENKKLKIQIELLKDVLK